jgi:hypothetical protein
MLFPTMLFSTMFPFTSAFMHSFGEAIPYASFCWIVQLKADVTGKLTFDFQYLTPIALDVMAKGIGTALL